MSDRVERKILALLSDSHESPYGNPIPGLDELGAGVPPEDFRSGLEMLTSVAGQEPREVVVRRIGEPVQADHEALALLTAAGLLPGRVALVRTEAERVIVYRAGMDESSGVSLPPDIAAHVFVALPRPS